MYDMISCGVGMKKRGLSAPPQSSFTANLAIIGVNCKLLIFILRLRGQIVPFCADFVRRHCAGGVLLLSSPEIIKVLCVRKEAVIQICVSSKGMCFSLPCCCWR